MQFEYFTKEEICKGLTEDIEDEYDLIDREMTCKTLYIAFNFVFDYLPEMRKELDKDNSLATQYAFARDHDILISEESLEFFNKLIHGYLLDDEMVDIDGYPMVSLCDFVGKDEIMCANIIAVCAIAYAWSHEYRSLQEDGITSKDRNQRRAKKLQRDYRKNKNKEALLKDYKKVDPENMKRMERIFFEPALNSLLEDNSYKDEIIQELKARILPRKY